MRKDSIVLGQKKLRGGGGGGGCRCVKLIEQTLHFVVQQLHWCELFVQSPSSI